MPDILHLLTINASPERVYQALTTPEGIRQWWTRDADLDSHVGGIGEFRFGSYGSSHATCIAVQELTPPRRVVWHVCQSFRPEWKGTEIIFTLEPANGKTQLHFAHQGFLQPDHIYALCNTGWAYYLVSLQQFLQTGTGAPSPDIDFSRLLQPS